MPKAKRKKNTSFETAMAKSVFLYGRPNRDKLSVLEKMSSSFCRMANGYIHILSNTTGYMLPLVKNDKKDALLRSLEKQLRPAGINSAFCQNAFDMAVTRVSCRLNDIRLEMMRYDHSIFVRSKVLFAMSLEGNSRGMMLAAMKALQGALKKPNDFYQECIDTLESLTDSEFSFLMLELADIYGMVRAEYRVPEIRSAEVPLDSRLMKIEDSTNTVFPFVIHITDPFRKNHRFTVPVDTSRHSLNKIRSHKMAGTVTASIRNGKLRIGWSYSISRKQPATDKVIGVDTGISDTLHLSEGGPIGSMKEVIGFYKDTVEPAFAGLSDIRNKKRSILHYLHTHDLPEDVRRSLIRKADRLEHMLQTAKSAFRKNRHYHQMLDREVTAAVKIYIHKISHDTLTVIEKLDIKEFKRNRKLNGMYSVFARGRIQEELKSSLNWYGYDLIEVEPDYTSQMCPVCFCLDEKNRNGKNFKCRCCGHTDDADHNASVNIRMRVDDGEVLEICEQHKYDHRKMQHSLKEIYRSRNEAYLKTAEPA